MENNPPEYKKLTFAVIVKQNLKNKSQMRNLIIFLTVFALAVSCKTMAPSYKITGMITGADDSATFVLQKRVAGKTVTLDSALLIKGQFVIKGGAVDYPEMVTLLEKTKRRGVSFYLENSDIVIKGHFDSLYNSEITGSRTQDEYMSLRKLLEPMNKKYSGLYKEYRELTQAGKNDEALVIEKQLDSIEKGMTDAQIAFVKNNPASFAAPNVLRSVSYYMDAAEIESIINGMDTAVKKIQVVHDLQTRVEAMKKVAVGQKAPDFTLNDVNDKPLSLYSVVGKPKILLVDFWASWCGPCRQENPNVVKVWKEFNKKGFDVFGVSLDRPGDKEKWLQAIKDDKLTWTHVSDLKYWDCEAAKLYAVNAIPANFLLDESGTIIARNLRGDDLFNKVKELLEKK